MKNAQILLVDDEEAIIKMIEMVLNKEGFQHIHTAINGKEALHIVKTNKLDFVVLDVMLPDISGFELCSKIREYTDVHILFLTAKMNDFDILTGFENGGDDYVTKPFNPLEVVARMKAHLKRRPREAAISKRIQHKKIYSFNNFVIDEDAGELIVNKEVIPCPAQEFLLLVYFCKHVNQVLSKEQLLNAVWGYEYAADDNTVMVHIRRIRERIEPDPSHPIYIITVRGLGYKLVRRNPV